MPNQEKKSSRKFFVGHDETIPLTRGESAALFQAHNVLAKKSPLYVAVSAIDVSRQLAVEHSGNFILRQLSRVFAMNDQRARDIVAQTEEFQACSESLVRQGQQKPERKKFANRAKQAYLDFLAGDTHPSARVFAASPQFQGYIKNQTAKAEIGPYFVRFLDVIRDGELIARRHENLQDIFAELDRNFFRFQRKLSDKGGSFPVTVISSADQIPALAQEIAEDLFHPVEEGDKNVARAFRKFLANNDILLNAVTDKEQPIWRRFVISFFPILYSYIRFEHNPQEYKDTTFIERAKKLSSGVGEEDLVCLMDYLYLSSLLNPSDMERAFDAKIIEGQLEPVRALVNFYRRAYWNKRDSKDFMPNERGSVEEALVDYTLGKISMADLDRLPDVWDRLRLVYCALPSDMQKGLVSYPVSEKEGNKTTGVWHPFGAVLLSRQLIQHPDIVIEAVKAGIGPTEERIEMLSRKQKVLVVAKELCSSLPAVPGCNRVTEYWVDRMLTGQASAEDLLAVPGSIQKVLEKVAAIDHIGNAAQVKDRLQSCLVQDVFRSPAILHNLEEVVLLLSRGVFPLSHLITYLSESGKGAMEQLEALRRETETGYFDPANLLQRDLEYMEYLRLATTTPAAHESGSFASFERLPYRPDSERRPVLDFGETMEAKAAAFEAANLFGFIQGRVNLRRKLAVLGFERYGALFALDPLRTFLEELEIPISTYPIHSSFNNGSELKQIMQSLRGYMEKEMPDDLVVVDGTSDAFRGDIPRLPRSMGYLCEGLETAIKALGYRVSHWVPSPGKQVIIGSDKAVPYSPPTEQDRQVILANPVISPQRFPGFPRDLKEHQPGFLDDPDKFDKPETLIAFTEKGVEVLAHSQTEAEFTQLIQSQMERVLPEYIRLVNSFR